MSFVKHKDSKETSFGEDSSGQQNLVSDNSDLRENNLITSLNDENENEGENNNEGIFTYSST